MRESIDYLTTKFGISREDALERLRLQHDLPEITRVLTDQYGEFYAGLVIDQDNGGRLVVYSTSDDLNRLRGLIPRYQHRLEIREVPWSQAELKRTEDEIRDRIGDKSGIFVGVKKAARLVVVGMTPRVERRCRASIEDLVEPYGDKVVIAAIEPTPELDDTGTPIRDK